MAAKNPFYDTIKYFILICLCYTKCDKTTVSFVDKTCESDDSLLKRKEKKNRFVVTSRSLVNSSGSELLKVPRVKNPRAVWEQW